MRPLTQALPGALTELLRPMPLSDGKVAFAWRAAVGPSVDRVTAVRLESGVLIVEAQDSNWSRELARSSDVVLARLRTLLGHDTVSRLEIRTRTYA
jgi:predicted nucleic acid-binding Zn ribbon protein